MVAGYAVAAAAAAGAGVAGGGGAAPEAEKPAAPVRGGSALAAVCTTETAAGPNRSTPEVLTLPLLSLMCTLAWVGRGSRAVSSADGCLPGGAGAAGRIVEAEDAAGVTGEVAGDVAASGDGVWGGGVAGPGGVCGDGGNVLSAAAGDSGADDSPPSAASADSAGSVASFVTSLWSAWCA